ncbi:MAG: C_GCAxxG_C_C family protein [Clostridiales bacterium]|nr:C_GCAxxG_C_C family protein [Clostridiales bacterium]
MEYSKKARELFKSGYNCAQSVLGAFSDITGLSLQKSVALASSFGGGMGGQRDYCGAVTGAFLVVGAILGDYSPLDNEAKTKHYQLIRQIADKFKAEFSSCICRELLTNLPKKLESNPLPRTEEYYKVRPCVLFVEYAASIVEELLNLQ